MNDIAVKLVEEALGTKHNRYELMYHILEGANIRAHQENLIKDLADAIKRVSKEYHMTIDAMMILNAVFHEFFKVAVFVKSDTIPLRTQMLQTQQLIDEMQNTITSLKLHMNSMAQKSNYLR